MPMETTPSYAPSLSELYRHLGIKLGQIDSLMEEGFTIHNLKDSDFKLPYHSPSFRPDYFSFLLIRDGSGEYSINQHNFLVKPNMLYFTNPSHYRTFSWNHINDIELITFNESFLKKYVSSNAYDEFEFLLSETVSPTSLTEPLLGQINTLFEQLNQEFYRSSSQKYRIIGLLLAILLYRIKEHFWQDYNPRNEQRSSQIVKDFKLAMQRHYRDLIEKKTNSIWHIQDYAERLNLHPNYLSNVIKSKTGKPISAWINEKTMDQAQLLLAKSDQPIKQISYLLGFSETAHFSNFFKKHGGISPLKFRKQAIAQTIL